MKTDGTLINNGLNADDSGKSREPNRLIINVFALNVAKNLVQYLYQNTKLQLKNAYPRGHPGMHVRGQSGDQQQLEEEVEDTDED